MSDAAGRRPSLLLSNEASDVCRVLGGSEWAAFLSGRHALMDGSLSWPVGVPMM